MKIGFIGAGRVGTAFGKYLSSGGFEVCGYFDREPEYAMRAAAAADCRHYTEDARLCRDSDLLFITTGDGQLKEVCDSLAARNAFRENQIVVHMSGAYPSSIFQSARDRGCQVCSLHPIQAFADVEKALEKLPCTVFSIEGDSRAAETLKGILAAMGNRYFGLSADDKTLYHAAACIFSNYLVTLLDQGLSLFNTIGIDSVEGFNAVLPLIMGTIENIGALGTEAALTGPIARGDIQTVARHLEAIRAQAPDTLELYSVMARHTLELAKRSRLRAPEAALTLEELLDTQSGSPN